MNPDFDTMNETDVREIIVRPLIHRLGFHHGTLANVRTEVTLRYDKAFLGRKSPTKDPPLIGRADYICEAISYGRWAIEVKAPSVELSKSDAEQAHTYCAHPEISASHFLLTNGRQFRLYATGELDAPLLEWSFEQTEGHMMILFNILGIEAIKKRSRIIRADVNKPLGRNLPSALKIVGGEVQYGEHISDNPFLATHAMNGLTAAVTSGSVRRIDDGRIEARVAVKSPLPQLEALNKIAGLGNFSFLSSEEFVSDQRGSPTIFQNVTSGRLDPGASFSPFPGLPEMVMPFGFNYTVYTEATGFFEEDCFEGILAFEYDYRFIKGPPSSIPQLQMMAAQMPPTAKLRGTGTFKISLVTS